MRARKTLGGRCAWLCVWCHRHLTEDAPDPDDRPTRDHLVARANGGSGRQRNSVLACPPCNNLKGDADLAAWLAYCGFPTDLRTSRSVIAWSLRARDMVAGPLARPPHCASTLARPARSARRTAHAGDAPPPASPAERYGGHRPARTSTT